MDLGYTLDLNQHHSGKVAQWVEGQPEKSFWTGVKTKDREVLPITTYRCPRCGFLSSFANPASGTGAP